MTPQEFVDRYRREEDEAHERNPEDENAERLRFRILPRDIPPLATTDAEVMAPYRQQAQMHGPMPRIDQSLRARARRWWVEFWMI